MSATSEVETDPTKVTIAKAIWFQTRKGHGIDLSIVSDASTTRLPCRRVSCAGLCAICDTFDWKSDSYGNIYMG